MSQDADLLEDDESALVTHRLRVKVTGRLDQAICEGIPALTRSRVIQLVRGERVTVNEVLRWKPSHHVVEGDDIVVSVPMLVAPEAKAEDIPITIAYEDADLVVVDKAAGMVVHPAPGNPTGTLVNALLHHIKDLSGVNGVMRPGIVHRLDRGTSGLLVVAKNDVAHVALAQQFADKTAGRDYLAICMGIPPFTQGTVRSNLARHPSERIRYASVEQGGRPAVTHWERRAVSGNLSLVGCRLETGRTHQVRVHLTESGWPLVGDELYDRRNVKLPPALAHLGPEGRPMLHAWRLRLIHPRTGKLLTVLSPPAPDFRALVDAAGLAAGLPPEVASLKKAGPA